MKLERVEIDGEIYLAVPTEESSSTYCKHCAFLGDIGCTLHSGDVSCYLKIYIKGD